MHPNIRLDLLVILIEFYYFINRAELKSFSSRVEFEYNNFLIDSIFIESNLSSSTIF